MTGLCLDAASGAGSGCRGLAEVALGSPPPEYILDEGISRRDVELVLVGRPEGAHRLREDALAPGVGEGSLLPLDFDVTIQVFS